MTRSQYCLYRFLGSKFFGSGDKDAYYPLGTARALSTCEICFLLAGGQRRFTISLFTDFSLSNFKSWMDAVGGASIAHDFQAYVCLQCNPDLISPCLWGSNAALREQAK